MAIQAGKAVVDLANNLNKANKVNEPITPKQFHSGSAQNVKQFNQLMNQPQSAQNVSKLSDLNRSGSVRIGAGTNTSPQLPVRDTPGDMILKGIQKMRSSYQGQVSEVMDTIKSGGASGTGLNPTEMIKVNYAVMQMQSWTGEITSVESNVKGTMQQLMSAQ